jgi:peptidoglycan/xylan/chitin deacetylase (PgdA/CDA1 family)
MAGFRKNFKRIASKGAGVLPTSFLQKVSNQHLILPFYHAISDPEMPHVKHLYAVKGVRAFTKDLDFLLKHYTPIGYNQFLEITSSQSLPQKPSFLLSFDDGLREFYDVIAPILLQKGVPAICFLNSSFVDNKDLFYRYKSSLLIDRIKKEPTLIKAIQSLLGGPQNTVEKILSITYQNKDLLNELATLMNFSFSDFLLNQAPYLTGDQIKSLVKQGFYFGGHSIDHPEYQFISLHEQIRQTKESIESICSTFSIDYKIFSFPFTDHNVSKEFFSYLMVNGIADNTFGCAGQKRDVVPNNFQRIPFEMKGLTGKQILNAELLYYLLKIPMGKNMVLRND